MAPRIFGKTERYLPTRKGRHRKARPKTFTTEAAAQKWAATHGIKEYTLSNSKNPEAKEKKLTIVQK